MSPDEKIKHLLSLGWQRRGDNDWLDPKGHGFSYICSGQSAPWMYTTDEAYAYATDNDAEFRRLTR